MTLTLLNPWVRGDGVGYYAYARAPLIEHSLDFTRDYQHANEGFRAELLDAAGNVRPEFFTSTGHLNNHFTVGPAILWAPFLLLAHLIVLLADALGASIPADGFSAPYRYAMAFGTGCYGFLCLWLSFRVTRKYVQATWAFLTTLAIWWASSLPVYMYFNPSWSHAHSAFAVALFLWYWDATREKRSAWQWIVLGLIVGLLLNTYYANLMVVSVLLVEAVRQYHQALRRGSPDTPTVAQLLSRQLLFGATVCVAMLPTFLSRWVVYGGPFETGYVSLHDFMWRSPALIQLLFSADHGLLAWTPLLAFSFLGLFLAAWRLPSIGVPLLLAGLAFYFFFTLYPDWDGISSYGNRFFVSLTPLFIFGLAVTLESFAGLFSRQRTAILVSSGALACFVLWNMGLIYQWGTHLIPARGPISFQTAAYNQFTLVPRELSSHLQSYFFRRSDMMRQIEQKDREQQLRNTTEP